MIRIVLAALSLFSCLWGSYAEAGSRLPTTVVEVSTFDELVSVFCTADQTKDLIMVLSAALFVDAKELVCPHGPYKMYRIIEHNDADDFEYYVDPPFGANKRLGCDGKAGRAMEILAVNCRAL